MNIKIRVNVDWVAVLRYNEELADVTYLYKQREAVSWSN